MQICALVKYPPIQGGVSARCYWIAQALARRGHNVRIVTNAGEVEEEYRLWIPPDDRNMLETAFQNGGSVTVVTSGGAKRSLKHIPQANPYVSKLSSIATEEIRFHSCDVVFSYYYEPYGMAGHLAASWTRKPHVIQHAGSDHGRLMNHPELSTAYREMLKRASLVVSSRSTFQALGIRPDHVIAPIRNGAFLPRRYFNGAAPPLDVDALIDLAREHPFVQNRAPWRPDVPVFGILGKVGRAKGSYDLIESLRILRKRGHDFSLLAMVGGTDRENFIAAVGEAGLAENTWTLPLLPHWRVPSFIRSCTAVCFMERRFPIKSHTPMVPQEVLACGTCAILSAEIAQKQGFSEKLIHGHNVFIVDNPSRTEPFLDVLLTVARDPQRVRQIGINGSSILPPVRDDEELGNYYEDLLRNAVSKGICADAVGDGSRATEVKRRSDVKSEVRNFLATQMPASFRLFRSDIESVLENLILENVVDGTDVSCLAHRVSETLFDLRANVNHPDLLQLEILRFEKECLWSVVDLEGSVGKPQFPRKNESLFRTRPATQPFECKPLRSDWLRISDYFGGIEEAVKTAKQNGNGYREKLSSHRIETYIFVKRGDLLPRAIKIDGATRDVVDLCDGTRTTGQIDAALAERGVALREGLWNLLYHLAKTGVLRGVPLHDNSENGFCIADRE
jgi:glycosyltransferase involved in cell wall biosynthesis